MRFSFLSRVRAEGNARVRQASPGPARVAGEEVGVLGVVAVSVLWLLAAGYPAPTALSVVFGIGLVAARIVQVNRAGRR